MGGEAPAAIPWGGADAYVNAYDWRELKRWHIPETAIPAGSEVRYRVPTFWEDYRGIVIGSVILFIIETSLILGLLVTIRQRRRAERSLRNSEEQVRLAAAAAGAGLWSMDREGAQIWGTEQARQLFGFTSDEPVNFEKVLHVIHPEDQELVRRLMQRAFETVEDAYLEYRVILPDGTVRWVAVRCSVPRHEPGATQFLMGTCVDITPRKHAEEALQLHQQELVTLAGRLIHNQEEELRRLSRELHDDLTQRLAILAIDAGMLEKTVLPQQPEAAAELRELKSRLIEVSNEVHHLSRQLHPSVLDDLGLVQAARAECEDFRRRTGIDLSFTLGDITARLSPDESLCLYRVLQEALQNMAKHSRAGEGHVSIEERPDAISLLIQDFGVGFDPQHVAGSGGIGLSSMRERVRLVNGTFAIESAPGEGTEIQVNIPRGGTPHVQTTDTDSR
jgi:PAS domain S-box-containing protein